MKAAVLPTALSLEAQRHAVQLKFLADGGDLTIGDGASCPLAPEVLAATKGNEPYVVRTLSSGLTAWVHLIRIGGRSWALKQARPACLVQNVDGQTSFLNELQRRQEIEALKALAGGRERFRGLTDTLYASLRHGIILTPWIDGELVHQWDARRLGQVFELGTELILAGLFEWDFSPGNLLDDGEQVWMFDFGYMYRFDPLRQLNTAGDGTDVPMFHLAERFETRNYFAYLLDCETHESRGFALNEFRIEKEIARAAFERLLSALRARGADALVLNATAKCIARWTEALRGDLQTLYLVEGWRSHVLDLDDDLRGKTCTPMTLRRADWLLGAVRDHYAALKAQSAFFWHDDGYSQAQLLATYARRRETAQRHQVGG
jgi:hypothetical protein